ncbi:MAG: hypothetical protein ACLP9L_11220 [Thermoguttaceae bacterium]
MEKLLRLAMLVSVALVVTTALRAEEKKVTFDNRDAIAGWTVTGDVTVDAGKTRVGAAGGSLKIGSGGKAIWKLGHADLSGKVEFWVYEDGAQAKEAKVHGYGSLWGVMSAKGHALVSGSIYAAYLAGDTTYATGEFDPAMKGDFPSFKCQCLGLARKVGWHKWTFNMDAEKGLTILVDDQKVTRFNWGMTDLPGIAAIVFVGDATKGGTQTLWVNSLTVAQGPAMTVKPTPPPPPPPFLPEKDAAKAEGAPVKYLDHVANKHPRLLFTANKIAQLKAFFNSPEGKLYHDQMEGYLAGCTVPKDRKMSPGWGQEYGLFKLPMVALHYVLTKDKASFEKSVAYLKWLAGEADWTDGGEPAVEDTPEAYAKVLGKMKHLSPQAERNSDTTASFTMVGAALTWDWLYNDLDPAFREQFRQILWQHARAMYYGGHKGGNPEGGYWRGMPNYNHRWFRDWGMTLAALGAAEGKPEEQWFLSEVEKELQFNATWLSVDGSQHEGPGYGSSSGALGMAFEVSDELTGSHYLDTPFYKTAAAYTLEISAPGMKEALHFADCFDKARSFHPFFLKTAATHQQVDVMDGIRHALQRNAKAWGTRDSAWESLLFDDPSTKGGGYAKLPTTVFLPDNGLAIARDSWQDNAVAVMFKCGPMGGYRTNAWRLSAKDAKGNLPYANVAHDHPDANSFVIFGDGDFLAETDRYPLKPGKLSSGHNTILINGLGQAVVGRPEGDVWQQPGSADMSDMARITAFKDAGNVVVVEGEAAGAYLAYNDAKAGKSRPAIDRFRRTFIWVKGSYILIFDDVCSPKPVEITWLIQGAKLEPVKEDEGRYRLAKGRAQCEFQLVADLPLKSKIGVSTANDHEKLMNWQQLQATAEGAAARFACVVDPWHKELKVALTSDGPDKATITVTGTGFTDTWKWTAAKGQFEAAIWHGSRQGGFDVTVDAETAVPPAP